MLQGKTYKARAYLKVPSVGGPLAAEADVVLAYYDGGAWTLTTGAATTQDAWELVETGEVTIPATATGARAFVRIKSTASSSEYIYEDEPRLQPMGFHNEHTQQFDDNGTETMVK
jgi:hypothetical protein